MSLALGLGEAVQGQSKQPEVSIDYDTKRVVLRDAAGKVKWSTHLKGYLGSVRPPHVLWDAERVYVTHEDGVTALNAKNGKLVWHAKGPADCMCLSRDLLLATECGQGEEVEANGRWVTACAVKNGKQVFKVRLPASNFDPEPIIELAGLFLVQKGEAPGGKGDTFIFDRNGRVRHRLKRQVVTGMSQGTDMVLLTSTDVVRLSPDDKVRWAAPFKGHQWIAGGGLVPLPGGDLLAFRFGRISDSGVDVIRLTPTTGKVAWEARCDRLGVTHSKYHHEARVVLEGDQLQVISRGSGGTFVEFMDLRSGRQMDRARR
jgi:hypothetical protein